MKRAYHIHTSHSDGVASIDLIIEKAITYSVEEISICDHDTLNGVYEIKNKLPENIKLIPGIEISAKNTKKDINFLNKNISLHILGYDFDLDNELFSTRIFNLVKKNNQMCFEIIKRWKVKYKFLSFDELSKNKSNKQIFKTDVAKYFVQKKIAKDIDDAFIKYINHPLCSDLHTYNISIKEAIDFIHEANGIVVWAHPFDILFASEKNSIKQDEVIDILDKLMEYKIDGLEVYYENYSLDQIKFLESLAKNHNLKLFGGSDYHGRDSDFFVCAKWKGYDL